MILLVSRSVDLRTRNKKLFDIHPSVSGSRMVNAEPYADADTIKYIINFIEILS